MKSQRVKNVRKSVQQSLEAFVYKCCIQNENVGHFSLSVWAIDLVPYPFELNKYYCHYSYGVEHIKVILH